MEYCTAFVHITTEWKLAFCERPGIIDITSKKMQYELGYNPTFNLLRLQLICT